MYNAYNTENTDKMRKSTTKKGSEPQKKKILFKPLNKNLYNFEHL